MFQDNTRTFHIGILDDNKAIQIKLTLIAHSLSINSIKYNFTAVEIPLDENIEKIIDNIEEAKVDYVWIDFDYSSIQEIAFNGIDIANALLARHEDFPLSIITSYEDKLYENDLPFKPENVISYEDFMNSNAIIDESTSDNIYLKRIIRQILNYEKEEIYYQKKLNKLLNDKNLNNNVEIDSAILKLDNKLENRLNAKLALPEKLKQDFANNKLDTLIEQLDKILGDYKN